MKQNGQKQRWSKSLMAGSLLLLALFLAFWLQTEYLKEEVNLQKELDRTVEDARRVVQDSIYANMETKMQDLLVKVQNMNKSPIRDIVSIQTKPKADTIIFNNPDDKNQPFGAVVVDNSTHFDVTYKLSDGDTVTVLESIKGEGLKDQNKKLFRSINFRSDSIKQEKVVQKLHLLLKDIAWASYSRIIFKDTTYQTAGLISSLAEKQKNVFGQEHSVTKAGSNFLLELRQYSFFLVQKIIPQIGFSIFLFAITCLAFFFVYRSLREQEQLLAMKNNFISNMTHELKTPIATISVALEAIKGFDLQKDPIKTNEYLQISQSELNRLSLLVNKVLTLTKFEKGMSGFTYRDVFLDQLIGEILSSMKLQFETHGVNVQTDFQENTAFLLQGDSVHLSNLLYNLIDNSMKYSDGDLTIRIALKKENTHIVLVFEDNGKGIPAEYQKRVFDRFFRIPSGDVHNVKGHGLGLSYVAQVVEKHKGSILLDSQEGKGTRITIKLPN